MTILNKFYFYISIQPLDKKLNHTGKKIYHFSILILNNQMLDV
jgi:hypothetical protein